MTNKEGNELKILPKISEALKSIGIEARYSPDFHVPWYTTRLDVDFDDIIDVIRRDNHETRRIANSRKKGCKTNLYAVVFLGKNFNNTTLYFRTIILSYNYTST